MAKNKDAISWKLIALAVMAAVLIAFCGFVRYAHAQGFQFPPQVDTDAERLEYLTELKEELRLWHNAHTNRKSKRASTIFFGEKFLAKSQEVERLINQYATYTWDENFGPSGAFVKNIPKPGSKWNPSVNELDYIGDRAVEIRDPIEDFTSGWVEEDATGVLTVTSTKSQWINMTKNDEVYLTKDMGADYFSGDFEHWLEIQVNTGTQNGGTAWWWGIANVINDFNDLRNNNDNYLSLESWDGGANNYVSVGEENTSFYSDSWTGAAFDTTYYIKVIRDEAVGSYGTLYGYIYSDSDRTTLVDTLSLALHSKDDFRYVYAANSFNQSVAIDAAYGFTQNLDMNPSTSPSTGPAGSFNMGGTPPGNINYQRIDYFDTIITP